MKNISNKRNISYKRRNIFHVGDSWIKRESQLYISIFHFGGLLYLFFSLRLNAERCNLLNWRLNRNDRVIRKRKQRKKRVREGE